MFGGYTCNTKDDWMRHLSEEYSHGRILGEWTPTTESFVGTTRCHGAFQGHWSIFIPNGP